MVIPLRKCFQLTLAGIARDPVMCVLPRHQHAGMESSAFKRIDGMFANCGSFSAAGMCHDVMHAVKFCRGAAPGLCQLASPRILRADEDQLCRSPGSNLLNYVRRERLQRRPAARTDPVKFTGQQPAVLFYCREHVRIYRYLTIIGFRFFSAAVLPL